MDIRWDLYLICTPHQILPIDIKQQSMVGKYKVITLCGSTKFKEQYLEAQKRLTLEGNIGESTRNEIAYAKSQGISVKYLE